MPAAITLGFLARRLAADGERAENRALRLEPALAFRIARLFSEPIEAIVDPDDATADGQSS
jgi:hypothetical protein